MVPHPQAGIVVPAPPPPKLCSTHFSRTSKHIPTNVWEMVWGYGSISVCSSRRLGGIKYESWWILKE